MGSGTSSEGIESIGKNSAENMLKFKESSQAAFVVGYTGEVGKALVKKLRRTRMFSKVTLIGRSEVEYNEDMLMASNMEQKVVDFDNIDASADVFQGHDVGYCCLGTTAGRDDHEYENLDRDMMKVAELAKTSGTNQFHLVSSMYADATCCDGDSRTKGDAEHAIKEMGFKRLSIYRPGHLMTNREDIKWSDYIMQLLLVPLDFFNPGWYTTQPATLAQAMMLVSIVPEQSEMDEPSSVYSSKDIQTVADSKRKEDLRKIGIRNKNVHLINLGSPEDPNLVRSRAWLAM